MRATLAAIGGLLCTTSAAQAQVATPPRAETDPKTVVSSDNTAVTPIPLDDLGYSRGLLSAAWSADGFRLFLSTNLTGRYNIWRTDAAGSWPVQLTQADDRQSGIVVSPDGKTVFFEQDKGGDEQYDIYAVPASGGAVVNLTNTPDLRETGMLISPDGQRIAMSVKAKAQGQTNLAVLDPATGKEKLLTAEADPQWDWSAAAWVEGGRAIIANRGFTDETAGEVWRIEVAAGKATRLLGKPKHVGDGASRLEDELDDRARLTESEPEAVAAAGRGRVDEHHRAAAIEHLHQRVERGVAQVEATVVGLDRHAIGTEFVERVDRFADRASDVRQRQRGKQPEPAPVRGHQLGSLPVARPCQLARGAIVAEMDAGRGDGQHRGADRQPVHERERRRLAPFR